MKNTITVTRVVLFAALKTIFQLNCLYRTATKMHAITPSAALSLGVASPKNTLPMTARRMMPTGAR